MAIYSYATLAQGLFLAGSIVSIKWAARLSYVAFILQALFLYLSIDVINGQNLTLFNMLSFLTWVMTGLVFMGGRWRTAHLRILIFPLNIMSILLVLLFPGYEVIDTSVRPSLLFHLFSSVVTLSVLCVAALQAILIALQTHQLRHKPVAIIQKLPPLETMEGLLFRLIRVGFILLTMVLVTSSYLFWDSLTIDLIVKVIMVVCAWLIFAIILLGRYLFGWRGSMAINSILCGVIVIFFAYIGSVLLL